MKEKLIYRNFIDPGRLIPFEVWIKESNLLILADKKLSREAEEALIQYRKDIEQYIYRNPLFKTTFKPLLFREDMPPIVREMAKASEKAGVGPMAAVAGSIAEFVGKKLLSFCHQIIVENGGDIFIQVKKKKRVGIYAGESPLSGKIALEIEGKDTPLGICCSAGTFGHSLSLGEADAVVALSPSAALADAVATAVGNIVKEDKDIEKGLNFFKKIPEIMGGLIIKGKKMGIWGKIKVVRI